MDNTLIEVTDSVPVHKGDVFFIEAAALHAIGKGIFIAEIRRIPTPLNVCTITADSAPTKKRVSSMLKKAKDVTVLDPAKDHSRENTVKHNGFTLKLIVKREYFTVFSSQLNKVRSPNSLLVHKGEPDIGGIKASRGDSIFVTVGIGIYYAEEKAKVILTKV